MAQASNPVDPDLRRSLVSFGVLYFVQGIAEPTEGLIAQPVRSLLRAWGHDAADIGIFGLVVSLPWALKPVFGLLTDFVPLLGRRRQSWLVLCSALTTLALAALWLFPVHTLGPLLALLLLPTLGVAFSDVVVDGLMVDEGQPRGLTGVLQSVQWAASWSATIATGALGGYLAQRGQQTWSFLLCGLCAALACGVATCVLREPRRIQAAIPLHRAGRTLWHAARQPSVVAVCLFLIFLNFNPYSNSVRYIYATEGLGLGEDTYGQILSAEAAAAVAAALVYGRYCRSLSLTLLLHAGIVSALACTLCWWLMRDARSALLVAVFNGFVMMFAALVQLDVAARFCPPEAAATVFAFLMAVSNLAASAAEALGGVLYTRWVHTVGQHGAFAWLVAVGAAFTALTWLIVPRLERMAAAWAAGVGVDTAPLA
jgi:predicted MFS family arabinose efflux permease